MNHRVSHDFDRTFKIGDIVKYLHDSNYGDDERYPLRLLKIGIKNIYVGGRITWFTDPTIRDENLRMSISEFIQSNMGLEFATAY